MNPPERQVGRLLLSVGAIAILLGILTADLAFLLWLFLVARSPIPTVLFLLSMALCLTGMLCLWLGRPRQK